MKFLINRTTTYAAEKPPHPKAESLMPFIGELDVQGYVTNVEQTGLWTIDLDMEGLVALAKECRIIVTTSPRSSYFCSTPLPSGAPEMMIEIYDGWRE